MSNLQRYNFKYSNIHHIYHQMDQSIHKRTRSAAIVDKQESKPPVQGETVPQPQPTEDKEKEKKDYDKMMKSLKKKIKNVEESKGQEKEDQPPKQGKSKQKKQKDKKEDDREQEGKQKKKKKSKQKDSQDQVKDEEQTGKDNHKNQKSQQKNKKEKKDKKQGEQDEVKQEQAKQATKQKAKKKKSRKQKVKPDNHEEDSLKEQEEEQPKPKKKKTKKKQPSDQQKSQDDSLSQQKPSKKKKIKKDGQKKRRGRKPSGPIKRKKFSIFERQQIINKKYRVKKKSHYLNRQSERAWGPMRAGPYRDTRKTSKQQQRKIIEALWGDGPGDKQKKQNQSQMQVENEEEKQREEDIKIEQQREPSKSKSKKKKKKVESDEQEETPKPKKKKSKKKKQSDDQRDRTLASSSTLKKKGKNAEQDSNIKYEGQSTKASTKVSTKKRKKKVSDSQQSNGGEKTKIQHDSDNEQRKSKKKKRKTQQQESQEQSQNDDDSKSTSKKQKKDGLKKQAKKNRAKSTRQQQKQFTKEQSQKIINLFAVDGGNYPEMMKQLPGIRLKKVRMHLRMLFHRVLDIITYQVQHVVKRKIKEWQQDEKVQIVRQLHRIRSSNRLLSESNVLFRDKITALMRSYNDQSQLDKVNESDIEFLYRKLQAFVRGYNTINRSKRTSAASITQSKTKQKQQRYKFSKEVTRKPIISGGHLLSKGVKNQFRDEPEQSQYSVSNKLIPPQKLIEQWNREQQKTLCELYVNNPQPDETICDNLKEKYGPDVKWRDFELLGRKIDQLVKYALIKLQNLTARPYSRQQRKMQIDRKRAKLYQRLKKESPDSQNLQNYYRQKLKTTSMFLYDAQLFQKEERLQYKHRIFKNLSLLQRQIFGHLQSYNLKTSLIKILIQEFPPEEDIEQAVKQAKKFSKWARNEQKKNNITSIKNIFVGQRQDIIRQGQQDFANEDSIMADIEKVQIIKRNFDGKQPSRAGQSMCFSDDEEKENRSHKKSVKLGSSQIGKEKKPIEIIVDDQIEVSDFQQPESAQHKTVGGQQKQYSVLQKLYAHLSKSDAK